jgi:sortase A
MRILCNLQRVLFAVGMVLLSFCAAAFIDGRVYSHIAVTRFEHQSNAQRLIATSVQRDAWHPDFSLWNQQRIRDYETSLPQHFDQPEAVLRVDKIHLVVPVLNGTGDLTLNRGVGRIIGTAPVGAPEGNLGIAGHRDGFFRGLKDLNIGDTVELETKKGAQVYVIDWVKIVTPDDVSVLKSTGAPSLTLVTCFPFYFIGSAPQRYVVHASLTNDSKRETQALNAALKKRDSDIKENAQ